MTRNKFTAFELLIEKVMEKPKNSLKSNIPSPRNPKISVKLTISKFKLNYEAKDTLIKSIIYHFIKRNNQIFKLNIAEIHSKLWSQDKLYNIKRKTQKIKVKLTSSKFELNYGNEDNLMKSLIFNFINRNNQIFKLKLVEDVRSKLWTENKFKNSSSDIKVRRRSRKLYTLASEKDFLNDWIATPSTKAHRNSLPSPLNPNMSLNFENRKPETLSRRSLPVRLDQPSFL